MERLSGEFRDREKFMRGAKRKDSPILKGYRLYHNCFRPHMSLKGKTPAQQAGIEVKGWKALIENAIQQGVLEPQTYSKKRASSRKKSGSRESRRG